VLAELLAAPLLPHVLDQQLGVPAHHRGHLAQRREGGDLLAELDPAEPFPMAELGTPRGRQGSPRKRVVLPEGWLDDTDGSGYGLTEELSETSGG